MRAELRRHPEYWLLGAAAVAWVPLVVMTVTGDDHAHHHAPVPFTAALGWWAVMVTAMMLPLVRRHARWLALRTLPATRVPAVAVFAMSHLGVWMAAGAVVIAATAPVRGSAAAVAAALLLAAAWHAAPARRRLLRRCAAARAPGITGWRAVSDWTRMGAQAGARCVGTCWALMVPMAVVHHPALLAGATLLLYGERRHGANPERRAGRITDACWLAGAGVVTGLLAAG
jgi:predicted metal-binding membrane protein